ncbi:MAG: PHP domain-containing protein [Deltaproteobacteria bacterium]|nr:PHP domain-containing protein [Deltaproteobacteria bacterium]
MTDHGNLFGAIAFADACKEHGVKPILGCEAYVTPHPHKRTSREKTGITDSGFHLVLLAENEVGWRNLMALASEAYLTGFYHKPRLDRDLLEAHSEGLIAISGHLSSELAYHLERFDRTNDDQHWQHALEAARWHARVFAGTAAGPRFYVELQEHIAEQAAINPHLIRLARELGLPLVCDNDAHFLFAEDHDAHDTLVCISTGKVKGDAARLRYPRELYVKSPREMRDLFRARYPEVADEACDNTLRIAHRCNVRLGSSSHAPMVRVDGRRTRWRGRWARTGRNGSSGSARGTRSARSILRRKPRRTFSTSQRGSATRRCAICARRGLVWRYAADSTITGAGPREARP